MNLHRRLAAGRTTIIVALACVALLAIPFGRARAQIEAGRVIDDSTHAPLVKLHVWLQAMTADGWKLVDSAATDRDGMFQLTLPRPGVYRIGFVGRDEPLYTGTVDTVAADSMEQREYALPIVRNKGVHVYVRSQVDLPAAPRAGSPAPLYPPELRSRGISGEITIQMVVDPNGRAEPASFKVITATDSALAESVRRIVPRAKYWPASIGGITVRQVMQQPFFFRTGSAP